MDCSCISIDADYQSEVLKQKVVVAKKQHYCQECSRIIAPGEKYELFVGICNSEFYTHKTCADCLSILTEFFCDGYYFGMVREDFENFILDCNGNIPESKIAALTPRVRGWTCGVIECAWERLGERLGED